MIWEAFELLRVAHGRSLRARKVAHFSRILRSLAKVAFQGEGELLGLARPLKPLARQSSTLVVAVFDVRGAPSLTNVHSLSDLVMW